MHFFLLMIPFSITLFNVFNICIFQQSETVKIHANFGFLRCRMRIANYEMCSNMNSDVMRSAFKAKMAWLFTYEE